MNKDINLLVICNVVNLLSHVCVFITPLLKHWLRWNRLAVCMGRDSIVGELGESGILIEGNLFGSDGQLWFRVGRGRSDCIELGNWMECQRKHFVCQFAQAS